ncbi:uncharacterized protein LOC120695876 [Panicum virgatum]|uniref:Uncharacterized protein n=1 Tax=Panicum virgatum TaxID=38727 RepID=A0A8T0W348_PANVG|nr:uncharacterized protein LOC120695876 [Panicum virgatum]KAG2640386.1 hypothetical protein PVAP13_2KG090100 [Panicum virgatum]KAG2640388.1 hypothetical protein PVAP13_2KG090100 [Panicum virgatum]
MRTEVIRADTIDEAADKILKVLKEDGSASRSVSSSNRDHVIYFDGWDGLGASAVLRAIARRVSPSAGRQGAPAAGLEFEQVVHIDCSVWESRRALQRAVAEQLKLPDQVMELLDVAYSIARSFFS